MLPLQWARSTQTQSCSPSTTRSFIISTLNLRHTTRTLRRRGRTTWTETCSGQKTRRVTLLSLAAGLRPARSTPCPLSSALSLQKRTRRIPTQVALETALSNNLKPPNRASSACSSKTSASLTRAMISNLCSIPYSLYPTHEGAENLRKTTWALKEVAISPTTLEVQEFIPRIAGVQRCNANLEELKGMECIKAGSLQQKC